MAQVRDSRGASSSARRNTVHHGSKGPLLMPATMSARIEKARSTTAAGGQAGGGHRAMKWAYNSDHTDPVNFGFMTLVPVDSVDATDQTVPVTSVKSHITSTAPSPGIQNNPRTRLSSSPYPFGAPDALKVLQETHKKTGILPPTPDPEYLPGITPYLQTYSTDLSSSQDIPRLTGEEYLQIPLRQSPVQNSFPYLPTAPVQQLTPQDDLAWQSDPIAELLESSQGYSHHAQNDGEKSQQPTIEPNHLPKGPIVNEQVQFKNSKRKFKPSSPAPTAPKELAPRSALIPALVYNKSKLFPSRYPAGEPNAYARAQPHKRQHTARRDSVLDDDDAEVSTICWRCQKFASVHVISGMCNSCLHEVNIHIWPSQGAVRLENLESLVLLLLPAHTEDIISGGPLTISRHGSWRIFQHKRPHLEYDFNALNDWDAWTLADQKARSTTLWGDDFAELADIARKYQQSLRTPNIALKAASTVLIAVCDLYNCFVTTTPDVPSFTYRETVLENIRIVRMCMRDAFLQLQYLALSPSELRERKDWFPSFLSATILAATAVIFLDILGACPSPLKEWIWGHDWHNRIAEMRHGGYGMLISVLKANTNGVNPLKLDCWDDEDPAKSAFIVETPKTYSARKNSLAPAPDSSTSLKEKRRHSVIGVLPKHKERNILLGQSPAAMEGLLALKAFQVRHDADLKDGENMFTKEMYAQAMSRPVGSLWKVFEMQN